MEREKFISIVNLYKNEKNIKRLVYRLIKFEYEEDKRKKSKWLSKNDITYIAERIIHSKHEIEEEEKRIHNEKINLLKEKLEVLKRNGHSEIEILDDYCLRYKEKDSDLHNIISFPVEINKINTSFLNETRLSINEAINYLLSINYIEGFEVKNTNPKVKKTVNLGKTVRYKSVK